MDTGRFSTLINETQERIEITLKTIQAREHHSAEQLERILSATLEEFSNSLEELHIAEEEVRTQNKELVEARQEVEAERQRYQDLFDLAPDSYLVTDQNGVILEANQAAAVMFEEEKKSLVGKSLASFAFNEDMKIFQQSLSRILEKHGPDEITPQYDWELRLHPRLGSPFYASISSIAIQSEDHDDTTLRWMIRDISERVNRTNALRKHYTQIHLLQEIAAEANHSRDINQALLFALQLTCAYTDFSIGHVFLFNEEEQILIPTDIWYPDPSTEIHDFRQGTGNTRVKPGEGLSGRAFERGETLWIVDVTQDGDFSRTSLDRLPDVGSGLFVPLMMGNKPAGVMEFFSGIKLQPDEALLGTMSHVGTLLGRVLERQIAQTALQEREALFRSVFEQSDLGILLSDLRANIVAANPAMLSMVGHEESELRGKSISKFIHTDDLDEGQRQFNQLVSGKQNSIHLEARLNTKSEGEIWVRISATQVDAQDHRTGFVLGMVEDITWQKQAESELLEVERYLAESRETQRQYLAQELHDGPMQDLYGVIYQLSSFPSGEDESKLDGIKTNIQNIIQSLRKITGELRPPALAPFGLKNGIQSRINKIRENHPEISIEFLCNDEGEKLSDAVRIALFRIFNQAMTNILRHSQAKNVFVNLIIDDHRVLLDIRDDGKGFEVPERWVELVRQDHFGLVGAAERAHSIGGQLSIGSEPGWGTFIRVEVDRDEPPSIRMGDRLSPIISRVGSSD